MRMVYTSSNCARLVIEPNIFSSIYIYGSRARGENRLRSDIDIAVDCPYANDGDWQQILDIIDQAVTEHLNLRAEGVPTSCKALRSCLYRERLFFIALPLKKAYAPQES